MPVIRSRTRRRRAGSHLRDPVTDTDDEVVTVEQAPAVQIVKALVSPDPPVGVGARLVYSLTVVNTGNTTLTDLVVTDSRAAATVDCDPAAGDPVNTVDELAVGAQVVCEAVYVVTQADVDAGVPIHNTATVDTDETPTVPSNPVDVPVVDAVPALSVLKVAVPNNLIEPGDVVYTVTATNTGNVTLSDVTVDRSVGRVVRV